MGCGRARALASIACLAVFAAAAVSASPQTPDAGSKAKPRASRRGKRARHKQFKPPEPPPPPPPVQIPAPPRLPPPQPRPPDVDEALQALLGRQQRSVPKTSAVVRTIVGFAALLALAYLGGTSRVKQLEQRYNVAQLMTTGLPFLLLGLLANQPIIGVLTPSVVSETGPLLPLGLGWIGFVIGCRFEARDLEHLPPGTSASALAMTLLPAAAMLATCAAAIFGLRQQVAGVDVLRDALLLATAGAMSARRTPALVQAWLGNSACPDRLVRVIELEQLAGVVGLMMISAYYRPAATVVAWHLPGTAWLFVTLGIGVAMGVVLYAALSLIRKGPQFTALLLGCVAFTAGIASYIRLSPVAVCFIAGAIAINVGGAWKENVRSVFEQLERPVYFVFMIIAGALWRPWQWEGWAVMAAFVISRSLSRWFSGFLLRRLWVADLGSGERRALTAGPMGALSVAIVVSAQDLYSGPTVPWIVTAVIGGSLVTEAMVQITARRPSPAPAFLAPASPPD